MKVIFLDIDGVLNYRGCKDHIGGCRGIERSCVEKLNRLVEETGAICVLSSTWRTIYPLKEMRQFLRDRGFAGKLVDQTPNFNRSGVRGLEIDAWLKNTNRGESIESFVILDDNSDMFPWRHRLVQTDDELGLTDVDVDRAIDMLNGAS